MKLKNRYLGLQFFTEGDQTPPVTDPVDPPTEPQGLSQEQVNDIIAKRMAKEKAKWQKELDTKVEEETRLASLDAEQRKQAELEIKIKALEEREASIKLQESKMATVGVLKTHGLSEAFVDFVIGSDDETTLANINALEKAFKDAVKAEVDNRIPGATPPAGGRQPGNKEMTKEEFKKLPLSKQNELYITDPEKYKQYF